MVPALGMARTTDLPNDPQPSRLQVLVVDDDADTAKSMAALLGLSGHDVRVAADGPTALEAAESDRPDVVLLDIGLPGMGGCEVARRLCTQAKHKPPFIIAVTGFGKEDAPRRSEESGIDLHLVKPVNWSQLSALLQRFMKLVCG